VVAFGEGGEESWSYRELAARVRRLALGLRGVEVERGNHVAILRANRPEWIAACLAAISAGAVVVPLDAQIGDEALGSVLTDSDDGHVSTTSDQAGRFEKLGEDIGLRPILLEVRDEAGGACLRVETRSCLGSNRATVRRCSTLRARRARRKGYR
jgi:long-subunit acyl-CoA synthetase (AMP-forming)